MQEKNEYRIPISYGVTWDNLSAPSLPKRKELETNLLNSIIKLAEAFGATDVEIGTINEAEDGSGKVVTLKAYGELDIESLGGSLKRAVDGFE